MDGGGLGIGLALSREADRRLAREAGFDRHLVKPAEIGALRELMGSLP